MSTLVVYHNPACSKCRGTVEILQDRGVAFELIEYLKTPPDRAALERILDLLTDSPSELVRKDKRFRELGLDEADTQTRESVLAMLLEHPELMQRPVVIRGEVIRGDVVRGDRAVVARPSEKVLELLSEG